MQPLLPPLLCWTTIICFIMFLGFTITTALGHLHCNMFPTLFQLHHCNSCATVPGFFLSESWQLSGVLCNLQNAQCLQIVNKLVTGCTWFLRTWIMHPFSISLHRSLNLRYVVRVTILVIQPLLLAWPKLMKPDCFNSVTSFKISLKMLINLVFTGACYAHKGWSSG